MSYYALKDVDWPWDDEDEGRAIVVRADTPEEAVKIATAIHLADFPGAGGVTWDVARLNLVAFGDASWEEDNQPRFESLTYYADGINGPPDLPPALSVPLPEIEGGDKGDEHCPVCGNEERGQGGYLSCECPAARDEAMSEIVAYRIKDYGDGWILQETLTDSERAIYAEQGNVVQALVPADRITALEKENERFRGALTAIAEAWDETDEWDGTNKFNASRDVARTALRDAGGGE